MNYELDDWDLGTDLIWYIHTYIPKDVNYAGISTLAAGG